MSLVDKIPPLVSALAFGYGVTMAAPEVSLSSLVTSPRTEKAQAAVQATNGSLPVSAPKALSPSLESRMHGPETSALQKLRSSGASSRYGESSAGERGG